MNVDTKFFSWDLWWNSNILSFLSKSLVILTDNKGAEHLANDWITRIVSKSHVMPFRLWDLLCLVKSQFVFGHYFWHLLKGYDCTPEIFLTESSVIVPKIHDHRGCIVLVLELKRILFGFIEHRVDAVDYMVCIDNFILLVPNIDVRITWFIIRTSWNISALENKSSNDVVVQSSWRFLTPQRFEVDLLVPSQIINYQFELDYTSFKVIFNDTYCFISF